MAEKSGRKHPFNREAETAGYDWFEGFSKATPAGQLATLKGVKCSHSLK